jgi:hypothetical protein
MHLMGLSSVMHKQIIIMELSLFDNYKDVHLILKNTLHDQISHIIYCSTIKLQAFSL